MNTPDLTSYRLIHRSIRQSTARLTTAVKGVVQEDRHDRGRQLARWYAGFEGELHTHHTLEDDFFFPALFQLVPSRWGPGLRLVPAPVPGAQKRAQPEPGPS